MKFVRDDSPIDAFDHDVSEEVVRLLARSPPLARDLHEFSAASRISSNIERISDDAMNIATRSGALANPDQTDDAADKEADYSVLMCLSTISQNLDGRLVSVIDCRMFGGLTEAETAAALDLRAAAVDQLWLRAREKLQMLLAA